MPKPVHRKVTQRHKTQRRLCVWERNFFDRKAWNRGLRRKVHALRDDENYTTCHSTASVHAVTRPSTPTCSTLSQAPISTDHIRRTTMLMYVSRRVRISVDLHVWMSIDIHAVARCTTGGGGLQPKKRFSSGLGDVSSYMFLRSFYPEEVGLGLSSLTGCDCRRCGSTEAAGGRHSGLLSLPLTTVLVLTSESVDTNLRTADVDTCLPLAVYIHIYIRIHPRNRSP